MTTTISPQALTEELIRRGHLPAGTQQISTVNRPWYISLVLGFAGWLAGIFSLGFVGMVFRINAPTEIALAGAVLLAAAFALYMADRRSQFFEQFALALSIAGQLALIWALFDATKSATLVAGLVTLLQLLLLVIMPNDLARRLAAFFACCAWALTIRLEWLGAWYFFKVNESLAFAPALFAWTMIWLPVIGVVHALIATELMWIKKSLRRIIRPALTGLIVGLCFGTWLSVPLGGNQSGWLAMWPLLDAAVALLAAYYAFRLRNRALIGVALIGALTHVGQFYYALGVTLLTKSVIMLAVGAVALLVARRASDER